MTTRTEFPPMSGGEAAWVMPEWMEQYRPLMAYPDRIEELCNTAPDWFANRIVAIMVVQVQQEVAMLTRLREAGLLAQVQEEGVGRATA